MTERDDEMVFLSFGPDYNDGELMRRSQLPDDAFEASVMIDGTNLDGGEPRQYQVWAVER